MRPINAAVSAVFGFLLCLPAVNALSADQPTRQPNVLLIMTDDQGYGDLGCHGNPVLKTPELDRIYRQSVRLTNFHVDPTCSPTRAALMTGRYSTRTGVWHTVMGRHMPRRGEVMMPAVFADSGYRTAIFGKWHLGDNFPFRPQDRGFHEVLVHGGGGVGQIPDFWGNDYFDDTYFRNDSPKKFDGYCTDVFFRAATEFITANKERPFFVYLTTNAPHGPYRVPDRYSNPYDSLVGRDAELAKFYGMIANIDENMGRLLGRLDELGLSGNTIVIFMTDNGTSRGATFTDYRGNEGKIVSGFNAGMRGRKGSPYEGGHRVPCFIRWPAAGITGGRDVSRLTAHLDLLPTLIELCGLKRPDGLKFDGVNIAPLLRGNTDDGTDRTLFAHHQELPRPEKHRFGCVMNENWRLVVRNDFEDKPKFELFDFAADPAQHTDVKDRHAHVAQRLRTAYENWWNEIAQEFDNDARIVVGDDRQNPTHLTCFEWHGSRRWWQRSIRAGIDDNGVWAIDVAREGKFQITLRRWPAESGAAITAALNGGNAISAIKAKIKIGDLEATQDIPDGAAEVEFCVRLKRGPAQLKTWLIGENAKSIGAYYADVKRMD